MYKVLREGAFPLELQVDPFQERFQRLFKDGKKVVYIKNEFDNSTFRYRCYNVMQAMEEDEEFVVTCFLPTELDRVSDYIEKIDLVILQRAMWDIDIDNFIFLSKQKGIPVVYDIDDLIYNPKYVPLYLNNLGILSEATKSFDVHFNFASKYYALAAQCDAYIVTNQFLGEIVKKDFSKPVEVIPNFLNKEQQRHSEIILKNREKDDSKFVIGYFSGSPSHKFDLEIVVDAMEKLMAKYEDIYFKIVGFINIPEKLMKFKDRIIQNPFVSYEELQYEIGEVDLNIVPLQNNLFNNCKSELKFFEAGIVKVPSCSSPTYSYREVISDKENGFLCREGEWFSTMEAVYLGVLERDRVADNAYQDSKDFFGVKRQKDRIKIVYKDILDLRE